MRSECILAVAKAIGRSPTAEEVKGIEDRLSRHMRQNATRDPPAALGMSRAERLAEAAKTAGEELTREAAKKKQRVALTIIAHDRNSRFVHDGPDQFARIKDLLGFSSRVGEARGNAMSVETLSNAIRDNALRQMIGTLEATNPKFFGLLADRQGERDLVRELHGDDTGNAVARQGARAFAELSEALRQRFNHAGGDVGKRDDWGMPHHDSQQLIAKAGKEQYVADTLPLVDRRQYIHEDGTLLDDEEMRQVLESIWLTKATDGANKIEPGQFRGNGMRANRGSDSRQLHFKDGDAYLQYFLKYSDRGLYENLVNHVARMARDIALVETLGPNSDLALAALVDRAEKEMAVTNPAKTGEWREKAADVTNLYRYVAGMRDPVAKQWLARGFENTRNWITASRLGSAFITSFQDNATMHLTAHVNGLSSVKLLLNHIAALNPANKMEKRLALRAGFGMAVYADAISSRFGSELLGAGWSRKLATTTLRASGLIAATEMRKRVYAVTMQDALGAVVKDHAKLTDLAPGDHAILLSKGITDTDWAVWRLAKPEYQSWIKRHVLTPDSIYAIPDEQLAHLGNPAQLRENAAVRLIGAITEETHMAVVEPGARDRAWINKMGNRGTWGGELVRSVLLFKSFPIAMINRHLLRALSLPSTGGKAAYLAAVIVGSTLAGMVSLQVDQIVSGKDPRKIDQWQNWVNAFLKGGALGMYGDFLFSDTTRYGQSPFESAEGPVLGLVADILKLTQGNAFKSAENKNVHLGADAVRFARGNVPLINLWYTKAAMDHLIWNQLSEYFSPGYLNRMRSRTRRQYQQDYWWTPSEDTPHRAPDLEHVTGKQP